MKSFVTKNNDNKICYNGKEIVVFIHFFVHLIQKK